MRAHRTFLLTGSRSLALPIPEGDDGIPMPGFTFDALWRRLGLHEEGAVAHRQIVEGDPATGIAEQMSVAVAAAGDDDNGPAPTFEQIGRSGHHCDEMAASASCRTAIQWRPPGSWATRSLMHDVAGELRPFGGRCPVTGATHHGRPSHLIRTELVFEQLSYVA